MKNAIVDSPKGFRRIKFANVRRFDKKVGGAVKGNTYFAYVYPTKLRIVRLKWSAGFKNNESTFVTIKYNKGNFSWSKNGKRCDFQSFVNFFGKIEKPIIVLRLQRIIAKFSEDLGHTYKKLREPKYNSIFARLFWPSLQKMGYRDAFLPSRHKVIGSLLRRYLTLKEVIRYILGSCGKKTYRLVCEKIKQYNLTYVLDRLYLFSKILTVDDIQKIMNRPGFHLSGNSPLYNDSQEFYNVVRYLKQFSKARLLSDNRDDFGFLVDSVRMWNDLGRPAVHTGITLSEHHEILSRESRQRKNPDFSLNPTEELLQIDGLRVEDYTIVVPKTSYELSTWSSIMNNCISGYAKHMSSGKVRLFGVEKDGELVYNAMYESVTNKDKIGPNYLLQQFYGRFNNHVDPKIVKTILDALPFRIFDIHYSVVRQNA